MYISWDTDVSRVFWPNQLASVEGLGGVELAAVRGADELLDLGVAVRAGDDRALVDVVVAADVVLDVVVLQAGEEGVLHVRVRVRVAVEQRILVVLGDEGLVGEDERVLGAAGALVEPAADPGLLIVDGVAVGVTSRHGRRPCWASPSGR